jgi:hypothetical protein
VGEFHIKTQIEAPKFDRPEINLPSVPIEGLTSPEIRIFGLKNMEEI